MVEGSLVNNNLGILTLVQEAGENKDRSVCVFGAGGARALSTKQEKA